jgi:hypothetical protein
MVRRSKSLKMVVYLVTAALVAMMILVPSVFATQETMIKEVSDHYALRWGLPCLSLRLLFT